MSSSCGTHLVEQLAQRHRLRNGGAILKFQPRHAAAGVEAQSRRAAIFTGAQVDRALERRKIDAQLGGVHIHDARVGGPRRGPVRACTMWQHQQGRETAAPRAAGRRYASLGGRPIVNFSDFHDPWVVNGGTPS
eukprot:COSAG01_NODE_10422_length_2170_cov_2.690971_3_plen_134_part_00